MQFHVEGMDCGSCVNKIETALARLPGVSNIRLNFATEKLDLTLAPDSATQPDDVAKTIKSLGFGVSADASLPNRPVSEIHHDLAASGPHWWQPRNGKQVVSLGAMRGAAYVISLFVLGYETWVLGIG